MHSCLGALLALSVVEGIEISFVLLSVYSELNWVVASLHIRGRPFYTTRGLEELPRDEEAAAEAQAHARKPGFNEKRTSSRFLSILEVLRFQILTLEAEG